MHKCCECSLRMWSKTSECERFLEDLFMIVAVIIAPARFRILCFGRL